MIAYHAGDGQSSKVMCQHLVTIMCQPSSITCHMTVLCILSLWDSCRGHIVVNLSPYRDMLPYRPCHVPLSPSSTLLGTCHSESCRVTTRSHSHHRTGSPSHLPYRCCHLALSQIHTDTVLTRVSF